MRKFFTLCATLLFIFSGISRSMGENTILDVEEEYECCGTINHDTVTNPDGSTTTTTTTTVTCDTPAELVAYLALAKK